MNSPVKPRARINKACNKDGGGGGTKNAEDLANEVGSSQAPPAADLSLPGSTSF